MKRLYLTWTLLGAVIWSLNGFAAGEAERVDNDIRELNHAEVLWGGPDKGGSFEDGTLAVFNGVGGFDDEFTVVPTPDASHGKLVLRHFRDTSKKRPEGGNKAYPFFLINVNGPFLHEFGVELSLKYRGPGEGFRPVAELHGSTVYYNADGSKAGEHATDIPLVNSPQWQVGKVALSFPDGWDGTSLSITLIPILKTTDSSGRYELLLDDLRLTRVPINPWVCDLAFYPSYDKLWISVSSRYKKPSAVVRLFNGHHGSDKRSDKPFFEKEIAIPATGTLDTFLDLAGVNLPEEFDLIIGSPDGEHIWSYPLTRKHYDWENSTIGITDKVLPPFTPMTVDGRTVGVVQRTYELDKLGLFKQVTSMGRNLLAAPMRLTADGKPVDVGQGSFAKQADDVVAYTATASAGDVALTLVNTIEYDGAAKFELTLAPQGDQPATLGKLVLDIPLTDRQSPLWHVCRDFLRSNAAGYPPEGQGLIWKNTDFNHPSYYGGKHAYFGYFIPYIYLGDEQRGLAWFADNDKNWGVDTSGVGPQLTLHRDGDTLTLRVHLVQVSTTIDAPRTLTFGLMASPAKPMPDNLHEWLTGQRKLGWVGSEYWGVAATFNGKYPQNRDWGLVDALQAVRRASLKGIRQTTISFGAAIQAWSDRVLPADMPEDMRWAIVGAAGTMMTIGRERPQYASLYWEEHNTNVHHEEVKTFGWEWAQEYYPWWSDYLKLYAGKPPATLKEFNYGMDYSAAPSYHNFALTQAAEFIKRGAGVYLDNTFARRNKNAVVSDAYRAPYITKVLNTQPSASIWAQRDYHKRLWVLHQTLSPKDTRAIMMIHMTNANILPMLSFNQINLDLEWRDEPREFQAKYSPELLRAETTGLHTGNLPTALANTHGMKERTNLASMCRRTRTGALLVHGARHAQGWKRYRPFVDMLAAFNAAAPDAIWWHYWSDDLPVTTDDSQVKPLLVRVGDRLLLTLCTWNPEPATVQVTLNLKTLGLRPTTAVDQEFPTLNAGTLEAAKVEAYMDAMLDDDSPADPIAEITGSVTKRDTNRLWWQNFVWTPAGFHPEHRKNYIELYYNSLSSDPDYQGDDSKYPLGFQGAMAYDAETGQLSVPLVGYGIRMIVLERND